MVKLGLDTIQESLRSGLVVNSAYQRLVISILDGPSDLEGIKLEEDGVRPLNTFLD